MSLKFSFVYYYIFAESKTTKGRDDLDWCSNSLGKCVLQKYGWSIVMEQLTISKQTPSDVYCRPCHDVGAYF